jgi:hypothetical protein
MRQGKYEEDYDTSHDRLFLAREEFCLTSLSSLTFDEEGEKGQEQGMHA